MLVWGSGLYGKVDEVPGLFYVATKFGHLWYIPLIPMGSHLVFEQTDDGWRGAPIGVSGKSVLVAYLRAALVLGVVFTGIWGYIGWTNNNPHESEALMTLMIASPILNLAALIWAFSSKSLRFASADKAVTLARQAGMDEEACKEIGAVCRQQAAAAPVQTQEFAEFKQERPPTQDEQG